MLGIHIFQETRPNFSVPFGSLLNLCVLNDRFQITIIPSRINPWSPDHLVTTTLGSYQHRIRPLGPLLHRPAHNMPKPHLSYPPYHSIDQSCNHTSVNTRDLPVPNPFLP